MTNEEAIEQIKDNICYNLPQCNDGFCKDDCPIEFLLNKQIPKKPGYVGHGHYICIKCHIYCLS